MEQGQKGVAIQCTHYVTGQQQYKAVPSLGATNEVTSFVFYLDQRFGRHRKVMVWRYRGQQSIWRSPLGGGAVQWCLWGWWANAVDSPHSSQPQWTCKETEGTEEGREAKEQPDGWKLLRMWHKGATTQLVWCQKPEGVKTFMSRGLSLCGRGGTRLASMPEISILGGMKLEGSSTLRFTWVLVPSMVEDFCRPK